MKKKIFSTLLMGAFFLASMSMFTSCKDYDDDINKNKSEIEALKAQLNTLQSSLSGLESSIASTYATKADLNALAGQIANLVTAQELEKAIKDCKDELQKAIDGKADKKDLQDLSTKVDGIDTNLNKLAGEVDGIKSALNDPETGLKAAWKQIDLQQKAITELELALQGKSSDPNLNKLYEQVQKQGEDIAKLLEDLKTLRKDFDDFKAEATADINDLKTRMQKAEEEIATFNAKLSVLTLFIDKMLTGLLVKTDYMLNGIETLPVHMLLSQAVISGGKYDEKTGLPGKRGDAGETWKKVLNTEYQGLDDYHDIWNELFNYQDFKLPLYWLGLAGDEIYNPIYKYVNVFPNSHAFYTLDPATAAIDGADLFFATDYKHNTEFGVYGDVYGQSRAAANTAIGQEDPIIVPVSAKLASAQVKGGVIDVPFTVNDKEKFVNTWVKNFVNAIEGAHTIDGTEIDPTFNFMITEWSVDAPYVAANVTSAGAGEGVTRAIQSDWAMVCPNLIHLIALADNDPEDVSTDYIPTPYKHWTKVDNMMVAANHLYPTAAIAVTSVPTHTVVYTETIDLKPFVETHASMFGARFTRDAALTDQELEELGLHYEYYIVDYTSDKYQDQESHHLQQVGDVTSSVFAPRSVEEATGNTIVDEVSKTGSIGREPIVRVELRNEAGDVLLVGYIKIQIVKEKERILEAGPFEFGDILMECSPGWGALTWHQVEAGIVEKLGVSPAEFEAQWELDSDWLDPNNPSLGYGAKRFVKMEDGKFYDEDTYIREIEKQFKLGDWTINDVLKNNVEFAVKYFKIFAGRILWTGDYTPLTDPLNKQQNVLVWELGTQYSAWSHAFKNGSDLTIQEDLDYVEYLTAPDKKGLSTQALETWVRFVKKGTNSNPIYVKLVVPAGKVKWAAGTVTNKTDGTKGNWFKLNSNETGDKEVHINVPTPRDDKDTRIGVYDKLIVERGGKDPNWNLDFDFDLTDYWKDGVVKYADIAENPLSKFKTFSGTPDQDKIYFYFTLPHVDKGNITNAANNWNAKYEDPELNPATDFGTWTVKGWSGKTYTLALYKLGEDEDGNLLADKAENYTRFERVWYLNTTYGKPEYIDAVMPVQRGTEIRVIKCDGKVFGLNNEGLAYDIKRIPSGTGLNPKPAEAYNAVDALGLQGYWLVRLTEKEITKTKISTKLRDASNVSKAHNKYITYWRDWIAEDILNYCGHTQLKEKETFTAYLEVDYAECYDIYAENSKYFNARFMRPLDFKPLAASGNIDARNNGVYFRVIDLLLGNYDKNKKIFNETAWTDWRNLVVWNGLTEGTNLWTFYGIHLDNGDFTSSYGAEIPYFDGDDSFDWTKKVSGHTALLGWNFTDKLLAEIRTDFGVTDASLIPQIDRTKADFNSLENRQKFMKLPIASMTVPGDATLDYQNARLDLTVATDGRLHYKNDNDNRKSFHLFVPIHWSYYFGDEFEDYTYNFFRSAPYAYAVISINYTQGNNNQ